MRRLSTFAWRSLTARPARSFLTIAGIALGVGVLFATVTTNAGITDSIDRTVRAIAGRSDMTVAALGEAGLSATTLDRIASTPGVAATSPELELRTYVERQPTTLADGRPGPAGYGGPVTVLGVDPAAYARIHDFAIVEGLPLAGDPTSILITERLREATGLGPGDHLTLLGSAAAGPAAYRIAGVIAGDGPVIRALGRTVIMPIDASRTLFGVGGATRVAIALAAGTTLGAVTTSLEERLTSEPFVFTTPADLETSLHASTADFQAMTALLAALALFVAAFIIFNTLSMSVIERVREVGLLRAAGTTRRQVHSLVLIQAAVLGIVGSVAGVVVGWVVAVATTGFVNSLQGIPLDRVEISATSVGITIGVGLFVTLAAALEPAWRAGRIAPVEALRPRLDPSAGTRARLRWLIGVLMVVAVAGVIAWPGGGVDVSVARPLAVYGVLLAGTLVTPFLLGPLGRVAGLPFAILLPAEERLTRGALVRDRSRAALTLGALTVGLAMVVAIGSVASNTRQAASAWLAGVIPGDEVVTSIRPSALDEGLAAQLAAVDGVARVTPIATFGVARDGARLDAAAVVGADFLADGRLVFVAGDRTAALRGLDTGGTVVLPAGQAARLGVGVGSTMAILGGSGAEVDLLVTGIVERSLPGDGGEAMLVGWRDATAGLGVLGADAFAVRFAPGKVETARPKLEEAARGLALEPNTLEQVEGAVGGALGRVFGLFDALAIVAVVMAGLGIVNTLTMNVLERVRELGILRAIGMTRRQVARMVVVEAAVLGLVGSLLGCLVGLATGAVLVVLAGGGAAFLVPWPTLGLAAAFGTLVAMAAAYQPARLAGRVTIVRAVQYE